MIGIVQPNADELSYLSNTGSESLRALDDRKRRQIELAKTIDSVREKRLPRDIGDDAGQIANLVVRIQEAGLFPTGRTVAKEFHLVSSSLADSCELIADS